MTLKTLLTLSIALSLAASARAQFGYGIGGSGELRANSILGSGGLRGDSIVGSGGLGGRFRLGAGDAAPAPQHTFGGFSTGPGGTRSAQKPFATYAPQPAVSPYLNLFRTDLQGGGNFNYSTLVEPQLKQQQVNQQLSRQSSQSSRQLQAIAAQPDLNPQGSKDQYPTGHQTVFNYMGHYFPQAQAHKKRSR